VSLPKDTRRLEWLLLTVAVLLGLLALCGCAGKWYQVNPTTRCRDWHDGTIECVEVIK